MKTPLFYLAPGAIARMPFNHSKPFVVGDAPVPVFKEYGWQAGETFVELETGEYLAVETGKGYLLGVAWFRRDF